MGLPLNRFSQGLRGLNGTHYAPATINRGKDGDPSKLTVPQVEWHKPDFKLPNQDVPPGDHGGGNGFIPGRDNLFRLSSGVVLDFKSGRVVYDPTNRVKGYWGDPNATISYSNGQNEQQMVISTEPRDQVLPRAETEFNKVLQQALNPSSAGQTGADIFNSSLDPVSIQYWLTAKEEAEKLVNNMTPEQKQMIAAFERHFPKSRLVEESKKFQASQSMSKI